MIIGIASTRQHMIGRDPSGSSLGDERPTHPLSPDWHQVPPVSDELSPWHPDELTNLAYHRPYEDPPNHGPNGASYSYPPSPRPNHVEIDPNSRETGAPETSPPPRGHLADEDHARQAASHAPSPSSSPDTNHLPDGT
jgi:hypothetical protein